ncbi:hypothetical protein CEUSTIGMA_g6838.t1 [Chlamydomonas eustigma]|uniref:guanylate cyclase n=1 Tax=Chlamydomonas eustigma TaxID=1157962 RepID=A0A250X8L1_9CHLO|nr:hypothetical protein CEUSTIGMA_g6838.t1 [Chlamydomonas eustigma]|eukprot:GAX79397.1 hypothetical protein CEUSTIGMA_g6838.t1 [Chlamydomonas eustigma]
MTTMEILDLYGKSHLVANMGTSIYDLLNGGLSDLHLHLRFLGQNLAAEVPVFYVDAVQNDSCELHHISQKEEMRTVMEAIINSAASILGSTIGIQLLMSREAGVWYDREVYKLSLPQEEKIHTYNREQHAEAAAQCTYTPSPSLFYRMFPFHFIIDQECRLLQVGSKLQDIASRMTKGSLIGHTLKIMYPDMEWNYQRLALLSACSFLLSTGSTTSARVGDGNGLMLKGQFFETEMDGAPVLVFMGSPRLTSLEHMRSHGLRLCDIPSHDMARDYLLINDQQRSEEDRIKQLQMDCDRMAKEARWIEKEAIWFEKEKNKAEAACERLKESLNQALSKLAEQDLLEIPDKSPSMHYSCIADIDMATPAGKALQLIDKILSGEKVRGACCKSQVHKR